MKQVVLIVGVLGLAACGVPPEEDAAAKVGFSSQTQKDAQFVSRDTLETSEAWARLLKDYR